MLHAEVTLYPLKSANSGTIINDSIKVLDNQNVDYKVGPIATHIHGQDDEVWKGIKTMYDNARKDGETNMVLTITNAADHT